MNLFGFVSWHVKKYWFVYLYLTPCLFGVIAPYFYPRICEYLGWIVVWIFAAPALLSLSCAIKDEYSIYVESVSVLSLTKKEEQA